MASMDELTRLAHAARLGQPRAIDAFIQACYPDVWRLCAALVDPQAAEDLAQETCLRAIGALRRFRGESSALTWMLAIARRVCIDELRARSRQQRRNRRIIEIAEEPLTWPDPAGDIGTRQLLATLDPDRRAAFVLTQIFRLSYQEAANICECPPGTIRSRVARARDDLIAQIAEHDQPNDRQTPERMA
jgi:RNA polymerase sigma-70 factor, ECF subfamily